MKRLVGFCLVLCISGVLGFDAWYAERLKKDPWDRQCRFEHSINYCAMLEYTCDCCQEAWRSRKGKSQAKRDKELVVWCTACHEFTAKT